MTDVDNNNSFSSIWSILASTITKKDSNSDSGSQKGGSTNSTPPLNPRVLLFQESSTKGHTLLFDSRRLQKAPPVVPPTPPSSSVTSPSTPTKKPFPHTPIEVISELMFGSIPLAQLETTKVHCIKDQEIIVTKLFSYRVDNSHLQIRGSELSQSYKTVEPSILNHHNSQTMDRKKSRSISMSDGTKQAFDLETNPIPKKTFALGVVFPLRVPSFKRFLLTHFAILDFRLRNMLSIIQQKCLWKFMISMHKYQNKKKTQINIESIHNLQEDSTFREAVQLFIESINALLVTPRLRNPIWLELLVLNIETQKYREISAKFLNDMSVLQQQFDNSKNNYFLSTAVAAVLSRHLNWIYSVCPKLKQKEIPYPGKFFQQLFEVYGNIGTHHVTKIVIVGKVKEHVKKFLTVLSYFLRFSDLLFDTIPSNFEWSPPKSFPEVSYNNDHFILIDPPISTPTNSEGSHPSPGRSLFGGFIDKYCGDFLIMGVPQYDFRSQLIDDLKSYVDTSLFPSYNNILEIKSSSCVVVNIDKSVCEVVSYEGNKSGEGNVFEDIHYKVVNRSPYLSNVFSVVQKMWGMKMQEEACIMYLEDKLKALVKKGMLLSEMEGQIDNTRISMELGIPLEEVQLEMQLLQPIMNCVEFCIK